MRSRALVWVLAFVAAAGIGFAGLVGIGCAIGANACPWRSVESDGTVASPQALFEANCALCHGRTGEGETGPSLTQGKASVLSKEELIAKISRGRPFQGMPRFKGTLSEDQIDAIAAFVIELREAS